MKTLKPEFKKGIVLNKRTIAVLNHVQMAFNGGGKDNLAAENTESLIPTCITYDTTPETGITPSPKVCADALGTGGD